MSNAVGVWIGYTADDLFEEKTGLYLAYVFLVDVLVKLSSLGELHED
jgi:hypothetical protein